MNELVQAVEEWSKNKGLDGTVFKTITDYENYVVSNTGDVIRLKYKDKKGAKRPFKLLKPSITKDGYAWVRLTNETGKKEFRVHRLVASEFVENVQNKEQVNHIDGNKLNNKVDNLEWSTRNENMQHAYDTGLKNTTNNMITSTKLKNSKPVKLTTKETGEIQYFLSARDCSKALGFSERWCDKIISSMNGDTKLYFVEYVSMDEVNSNTDKTSLKTLVQLVEYWSFQKGLHKSDSAKQFVKCSEEVGEVASALARGDKELLEDGIGDVIVTLIILSQQNGMNIETCLDTAYNEIKGRTGKMINGTFVKSEDLK